MNREEIETTNKSTDSSTAPSYNTSGGKGGTIALGLGVVALVGVGAYLFLKKHQGVGRSIAEQLESFNSKEQQNTELPGKISATTSASATQSLLDEAVAAGHGRSMREKAASVKVKYLWPADDQTTSDLSSFPKWTVHQAKVTFLTYKFPQTRSGLAQTLALIIAGMPWLLVQSASKTTRIRIDCADHGITILKFYNGGATKAAQWLRQNTQQAIENTGFTKRWLDGGERNYEKITPSEVAKSTHAQFRKTWADQKWLFGDWPWRLAQSDDVELVVDNGSISSATALKRRSGANTIIMVQNRRTWAQASHAAAKWWIAWCKNASKVGDANKAKRWSPENTWPSIKKAFIVAGGYQNNTDQSDSAMTALAKGRGWRGVWHWFWSTFYDPDPELFDARISAQHPADDSLTFWTPENMLPDPELLVSDSYSGGSENDQLNDD